MNLPRAAQLEPVGPARVPVLMSFTAYTELLAAQPQLKELQLQGAGEPLAHPRFFDMVAYAVARGIEVTSTSALLALSDERIDDCIASGLRRLDVAPGAATAADCDYLRPGSKLRRALRNAKRLAIAKKRKPPGHPEIRLGLMLLRRNLADLPELVRLAREHGAGAVVFQHLWHDVSPARRFVDAESLLKQDPAILEPHFAAARAKADELGVELALPRSRSSSGPCEQPWRRVHVGASGAALPCAKLKSAQRPSLGHMRYEGVVEVWNNGAFREFRARLRSGRPPPVCRGCAMFHASA